MAEGWNFGYERQDDWARARLRVARAAELKGDSGTARAALSRCIERWKDGDQSIPELRAARRNLARLQAASGH